MVTVAFRLCGLRCEFCEEPHRAFPACSDVSICCTTSLVDHDPSKNALLLLTTIFGALAARCGNASDDPRARQDAGLSLDAARRDASGAGDASAVDRADGGSPEDGSALGTWASLTPLARGPRQETAVVALGGEVYVLGGFNAARQIVATVEAYDPARDGWRDVADLPVALHHANAAATNNRIYVTGYLVSGFAESGRTFEYDPATNAWSERTPLPLGRARGASATVAHDDLLYVIGGIRGLQSVADVDQYDPVLDEWRSLPPLPRTSDHIVAGAIGDFIYVAGGRAGGIEGHTDRLDVFRPSTLEWTIGPSMPTSRGGHAASVAAGRLYVFGGEGDRFSPPSFVFDETESYDPAANLWRTLVRMPTPRHGTGAATVGDRIYVPGGADVQAFAAVDTNEVFVPPP